MTVTHKCCKLVGGSWGIYAGSPCGKTASVEEVGKWYCKTHAPSLVAAKREAQDAKWRAASRAAEVARNRDRVISDAKARIVELAREWVRCEATGRHKDILSIHASLTLAVAEIERLERQS